MIKVYQDEFTTRTPDGGYLTKGNCFTAALASLLEIPIRDCPPIHECPGDGSWFRWTWEFLAARGLTMDTVHTAPIGYSIASGPSPRGPWGHSVIYYGGALFHDPHPAGGGVESVDYYLVIRPLSAEEKASAA